MRQEALIMMIIFLATVFSAISVVLPQCQPPNDCSVHVFRVRLSQKPEGEEPVENTTYSPNSPSYKQNEFPVLLVTFLLFVGIFLGILFTAFCLFMADTRKEPQFDRSSAVIYTKVGDNSSNATEMRPMLRREIEMVRQDQMESGSVARSMSSAGTRPWHKASSSVPQSTSRHISL
uniref:Uncharacterized protein n=1 Tax=Caenorhabditis japonica TaxID=281687 RepID=A0A8R1DIK0_CAEJA